MLPRLDRMFIQPRVQLPSIKSQPCGSAVSELDEADPALFDKAAYMAMGSPKICRRTIEIKQFTASVSVRGSLNLGLFVLTHKAMSPSPLSRIEGCITSCSQEPGGSYSPTSGSPDIKIKWP